MEIDITPILTAVTKVLIGVLATIITTKLIPWIQSKLSDQQLSIVKEFIKVAVKAAEQLYNSEEGEAKLEYATKAVEEFMTSINLKLDATEIRNLIEAAVLELHNQLEE